ncbi:MAG: sulfite exporter TauE/SafE family protein [Bdellovibrionota bacterium]
MIFELMLLGTAIIAGGVASVAGFGIGSLVTPVLSLSIGTKLAIAVVSIPHLIATALRFAMLRSHVDRRLLLGFGLMSILGGVTGATGLSEKMRFHGILAWIAGAVSGFLGGLVGNQGGIRSAALLGANISKESFVATATAIGLAVDVARMPVYFWSEHEGILASGTWIGISTLGVVIGTLLGTKLLKRLPERTFRRTVSVLIFLLGGFMFFQGIN